jgi:hypothetical protein
MNPCKHRNLLLLPPPKDRIRCRHCHLTIKRAELTGRYCPECYETRGVKRNDFEEVAEAENEKVYYCCEDCQMTWHC